MRILCILLFLCALPLFPRTVRVAPVNGAPHILVDGEPVRPRMFYGYPSVMRQGSVPLTNSWKTVTFEFSAPADDAQTALHLRFGEFAGDIYFDELIIKDITAGKDIAVSSSNDGTPFPAPWGYWCTDKQGPVTFQLDAGIGGAGDGALKIRLDKDARLKGFHIFYTPFTIEKGHRYRVSIQAKSSGNRTLTMSAKHQGGDFRTYGGLPTPFGDEVKLASAHGVRFISFEIPLSWPEPGKTADNGPAVAACREVLQNDPRSLLIPRISMNVPSWWRQKYPNDTVMRENGDRMPYPSVASSRYREDAVQALKSLIRTLETEFPDAMAGYFPSGQNTGEWFYPEAWANTLTGFEPAMRDAWKAKSGLALPTAEERHMNMRGAIRDSGRERVVIAFHSFLQELMADTILLFAKCIREETAGTRLSLFFNGYTFQCATYFCGPGVTGHYALRRLLDSPDVDIICAPIAYNDRGIGGSASCMGPAESVALAGKLWLSEDDTRTFLAAPYPFDYPGWVSGVDTREDTIALLRRNTAQASMRNMVSYWMDLGATGWFNDAALWGMLNELKPLDEYASKNAPSVPPLALVADEKSMMYIAGSGSSKYTSRTLLYEAREHAARCGVPYGQYLFDDVIAGRTRSALYACLGTLAATADERKRAAQVMSNASVIWCWAPGYIDDESSSPSFIEEMTGFAVTALSKGVIAQVTPTDRGKAMGIRMPFGPDQPVVPLFSPAVNSGDEVLAVYADGSPAVVLRKRGKYISVFCGTTGLSPSFFRAVAHAAGIHVYSDTDVNLWVNGPYIALHASSDEPVTLRLETAAPVTDILTGTVVGAGPAIPLSLRNGTTAVYRIGK